ncbi:MAG TPA: ATP-binding cassette domain-containing protein [Candidatus Dormibacteraeota bacterium]|nr:ATP-binding cassette domain-containing protein [Candidatus Dormibacteraeota bacterium]
MPPTTPKASSDSPPNDSPLLRVRHLKKTFVLPDGRQIPAVDDVDFDLRAGETLAVVGESGCGKTTLARLLVRLLEPDGGQIVFLGRDWLQARGGELRRLRRQMQMIFQDPYGSLDPRQPVSSAVAEPLEIHEAGLDRNERRRRLEEAIEAVGLGKETLGRFPHEFSGGQRQRVAIARALVLRPKLVVADEPVSALDPSIGAQILDLLARLQERFGLTYIFISHSLPVVARLATRIAVMRQGRWVEVGDAAEVLDHPRHDYTRALLDAVPELPGARGG